MHLQQAMVAAAAAAAASCREECYPNTVMAW
jgi:hypothetical protein